MSTQKAKAAEELASAVRVYCEGHSYLKPALSELYRLAIDYEEAAPDDAPTPALDESLNPNTEPETRDEWMMRAAQEIYGLKCWHEGGFDEFVYTAAGIIDKHAPTPVADTLATCVEALLSDQPLAEVATRQALDSYRKARDAKAEQDDAPTPDLERLKIYREAFLSFKFYLDAHPDELRELGMSREDALRKARDWELKILEMELDYPQHAPSAEITLAQDTVRLNWIEGELAREQEQLKQMGAVKQRSLFRQNLPITRAAIDQAMQAERAAKGNL